MAAVLTDIEMISLLRIRFISQRDLLELNDLGYGPWTAHYQLCKELNDTVERTKRESNRRFTRAHRRAVLGLLARVSQLRMEWMDFKENHPLRVPRYLGH